ncbi:MAG: FAD-binding oxidoreductase [Saprospiraceae bacterium]
MHLDQRHIDYFTELLGDSFVLSAKDDTFANYASDQTEDLVFFPALVLIPADTLQISSVMKYCNQHLLPITVRGAGTGLAAAALATHGGIVLSMQRFSRILDIDQRNLQVTTEPGVITQVLQDAVKEKGLFYPPDPASKGSCFIGGNVSHNSGGPKAVKYGVVKDYVLNLELVLPTGDIIWTAANTLKNSTGYNLTHLLVGSEGTLGVITKIVLKLIPYPPLSLLLFAPFSSAEKACEAVSAIFRAGITPSGLEFMERNAVLWSSKYLGMMPFQMKEGEEAYLLVELDGSQQDILYEDAQKVGEVLSLFDTGEILVADSEAQKEAIWKVRRSINPAIRSFSYKKELDIVVPRANLPLVLRAVKKIGEQYGFETVSYGHAGDGNLHVNIVRGELSDDFWKNQIPFAVKDIFREIILLGGLLSGEHGIGYVQRPYMDMMFPEIQLELMRKIKSAFDPNHILNPGKIF